MHHQCISQGHSGSMETDLTKIRQWLFEDFKARVALLVPPLLEQNPDMEAFDLMAAIEAAEAPRPLRPDHKAFVLDQYIQARWVADQAGPRPLVRRLPRRRNPVYRR